MPCTPYEARWFAAKQGNTRTYCLTPKNLYNMLQVDYTKKMGAVTLKDGNRLGMYQCNALTAFVEFSKDENGKEFRWLHFFIGNAGHCKNMLKHYGRVLPWDAIVRITLDTSYPESRTLLPFLLDSGYKVICKGTSRPVQKRAIK